MKRIFIVLITLVFLASCATYRDQQKIKEGMLTMNLRQSAFLKEWGKPYKIHTTTSEEIMSAGWNGMGGGFRKGKDVLEVWVYDTKKTELVFNRRKLLVNFRTEATVEELTTPKK
jgi:hypothetical protein